MRVLGIETSGPLGGVALQEDGRVLEARAFREGMRQGRDLVPSIAAFLDGRGWRVADLHLLAVSQGPGSYTGLRVGLACAKALAYASGVPLVGVNSLDVLVRNAGAVVSSAGGGGREWSPAPARHVAVILDARWKQVYARAYARTADGWDPVTETLVGVPDRVRVQLPQGATLIGDGAVRYPEIFGPPDFAPAPEAWNAPDPAWVARLGEAAFRAGRRDDPMTLVPLYLRPTEAEVKWGVKPMPGV